MWILFSNAFTYLIYNEYKQSLNSRIGSQTTAHVMKGHLKGFKILNGIKRKGASACKLLIIGDSLITITIYNTT